MKIQDRNITKYILFILIIISNLESITFASSNHESECPQISEARKQLDPWVQAALRSGYSIGCPTSSVDAAISKLETISETEGKCKDIAGGTLGAFFAIFNAHPDYKMCGLQQKEDIFWSKFVVDGDVCAKNLPANQITRCFTEMQVRVGRLKKMGALTEAFILAKKTADNDDPSGLIQLILGFMYENGEGTEKNTLLAIEWFKKAAERIDDRALRITSIIALSVAHEEIHDYKSAEKYALQCAVMGDPNCKNGLNRMRKKYGIG